jgi:hypothetical protein
MLSTIHLISQAARDSGTPNRSQFRASRRVCSGILAAKPEGMMRNPLNGNLGPDELASHITKTYLSLRRGIIILAVCFPLILWIGGKLWAHLPLQDSMSAYYFAGSPGRTMRDWFVGLLFAVGVFLVLYRGYSHAEDYLLNAAGTLCVCIAIIPMAWDQPQKSVLSLHGVCAVSFFVCIALVCFFCADDTLPLVTDLEKRERLRKLYKLQSIILVFSPVAAYTLAQLSGGKRFAFLAEAFGIFSFAWYWLTKSAEIAATSADELASQGRLLIENGEVRLAGPHDLRRVRK